jgi:hypothetical protein
VGIAQAGVIFVVEGNAEAVEVDGEGILRLVSSGSLQQF